MFRFRAVYDKVLSFKKIKFSTSFSSELHLKIINQSTTDHI